MKAPRAGYGKQYAVKWLGINEETMYTGAMTEEEAKRLVLGGHWHSKAFPSVEKLRLYNAGEK